MLTEKSRKPFSEIFFYFIPPISVIYLEILLRLTTKTFKLTAHSIGGTLFPLAVTLAAAGIMMLLRTRRTARALTIAVNELVIIPYLFCYFMFDAYKVYMPPSIVISEAGNAVSNFGSSVLSSILRGIPFILLYHLTMLLFIVGKNAPQRRKDKKRVTRFAFSLLVALVFWLLGIILCDLNGSGRNEVRDNTFSVNVEEYGALFTLAEEIFGDVVPQEESEGDSFIIHAEEVLSVPGESGTAAETFKETVADAPDDPKLPVQQNKAPVEDEVVEYGENVMDIELDPDKVGGNMPAVLEYVSSVQPTGKNRYTGIFKGKNLILITAEAFSKEVIDKDLTPTLYRLANSGIVFEEFYQPAWGGSTSTGEFSWLTGLAPHDPLVMSLSKTKKLPFTMGNVLMREGYYSAAFHNGEYTYYSRNKTHPNLGYSTFTGVNNGLEAGLTRGVFPHSDREMIDFTVPTYIDKQPFSIYYMTVSAHSPYTFKDGANDMAVKNRAVGEKYNASEGVQAYYACNQELELALASLIRQLEEAGIADDTVIALVSDHYPYGLLPSNAWGGKTDLLDELYGFKPTTCPEQDHNAAILWCGCLERDYDEPIVVSKPVSSLDILPTLLNLFGVEFDSRLLAGRDVLSDCAPLVFWNDTCWISERGFYDSHTKTFHANPGYECDEEYIEKICQEVKNRLKFSSEVINKDVYRYLFPDD